MIFLLTKARVSFLTYQTIISNFFPPFDILEQLGCTKISRYKIFILFFYKFFSFFFVIVFYVLGDNTLVGENVYKRVKNTCLRENKWLITEKRTNDKKANGKQKNTEEYINREFFSISRQGLYAIIYQVFPFYFAQFFSFFLFLAKLAAHYNAHTAIIIFFQYIYKNK